MTNFHEKKINLTNVFKVMDFLLEHPEKRAQKIANELKISKSQLIEIYHFIAARSDFQDLLFSNSKYPQSTVPLKEYLEDRVRIENIIKGKAINPYIVEMHLGEDCNLDCAMCYSRGINYPEKGISKSLTRDEISQLLGEFKKENVQEIWFSGGKEPLMSRLTLETMKRANKMGFVTRLYTNGILLDSFKKQKMVLDCYQVRFSLNASNAITYNKIHFKSRRIKDGSKIFAKVINNLKQLVKLKKIYQKNVKIAASFILQPLNLHEILSFVSFASKLGVDSIQIRTEAVGKVRSFKSSEKKIILRQIKKIMIKKDKGDYGQIEIDLRGATEEELNADKNENQFLPGLKKAKICRAKAYKLGINPYGKVYSCEFCMHPGNVSEKPYSNENLGNLRKDNFKRIIEQSSGKYSRTCKRCQAFEYGLNIFLEKLYDDYLWGIKIVDQPYCKRYQT